MGPPDPRIAPWRPDLAAIHLEGQVPSSRFVIPAPACVAVPVLDLFATPDDAGLASQLVCGEVFDVLETDAGWAWGQNQSDGYVGYVRASGLNALVEAETIRIGALAGHAYPVADIKSQPTLRLPQEARLSVLERTGDFVRTPLGFVPQAHLKPHAADPVAAAEAYLGVPYLWGGRSSFGLDCSALVQVMMRAAGRRFVRDSDLQACEGVDISGPLQRGDLVFWRGHVGIMRSADEVLHANAHFMEVTSEPLARAEKRIAQTQTGDVTTRRRVL